MEAISSKNSNHQNHHNEWYYVDRHGDHVGPCDAQELSHRFVDGSLTTASMVRLGPSSWTSLARARGAKDGAWSAIEKSQAEETRQGVVSPALKARLFWSYIDVAGHEQGPFDTERMIEWHRRGHFRDDSLVRLWPHGWVTLGRMLHLLPRSEAIIDSYIAGYEAGLKRKRDDSSDESEKSERGEQRTHETGWETI